jgi:DNA-directed RNA polymerase subunit RPC12/RpoP
MFICKDCDRPFKEPVSDDGIDVCPYCGSERIFSLREEK